jgi:hypothetical protein
MIALDIEGNEWSNYSRHMSQDEIRQHGKPILSAGQQLREGLAESGMHISGVDEDGTVNIVAGEKPKKKKGQKNLLDDDEQPI